MSQAKYTDNPKRSRMAAGQRYGRLVAIRYTGRNSFGQSRWLFRCRCGNTPEIDAAHVRSGHTKSCGCIARERAATLFTRHGLSHRPEYKIWKGMKKRCSNPRDTNFPRYGGRGICVCRKWELSFARFFADLGPRPSKHHSLERIKNDGDYKPGNVLWANRKRQSRNRRSSRIVTFRGRKMVLADACDLSGADYRLVSDRLRRGWTFHQALIVPKGQLLRQFAACGASTARQRFGRRSRRSGRTTDVRF